jgi:hypothetical protein
MEHLTVEDLTEEELADYRERLAHLMGDGYPEPTAASICLSAIQVKREFAK